jgi:hypothetical protein
MIKKTVKELDFNGPPGRFTRFQPGKFIFCNNVILRAEILVQEG